MKLSLLRREVDILEDEIWNCKKCKNLRDAIDSGDQMHPVPGFGFDSYSKKIVILCEAPGARKSWQKRENDSKTVEEFHNWYDDRMKNGAAISKYVNTILKRAKYSVDDVFWTNVIKCPPPNYRSPEQHEIDNCIPYLQRQIDLIKPLIIICFGKYAKRVFEDRHIITKAKIIYSYHPSYLQRYISLEKRNVQEEKIIKLLLES